MGLCKQTELLSLPAYAGFTRMPEFFFPLRWRKFKNPRGGGGEMIPFVDADFSTTPFPFIVPRFRVPLILLFPLARTQLIVRLWHHFAPKNKSRKTQIGGIHHQPPSN